MSGEVNMDMDYLKEERFKITITFNHNEYLSAIVGSDQRLNNG